MMKELIQTSFSVIVFGPTMEKFTNCISNDPDASAILTIGVERVIQAHFFHDLICGTSLWLKANGTFQLNDPSGYNTGPVLAQKMVFADDDVSIWHQDLRISFTCQANLKTGFCFGWLIDRRYSKSCRILDPGKAG